MRLISLRRFNQEPTGWTEPISLTLTKAGETVVLGTFIPDGIKQQPEKPQEVAPRRMTTDEILRKVAKK